MVSIDGGATISQTIRWVHYGSFFELNPSIRSQRYSARKEWPRARKRHWQCEKLPGDLYITKPISAIAGKRGTSATPYNTKPTVNVIPAKLSVNACSSGAPTAAYRQESGLQKWTHSHKNSF